MDYYYDKKGGRGLMVGSEVGGAAFEQIQMKYILLQ